MRKAYLCECGAEVPELGDECEDCTALRNAPQCPACAYTMDDAISEAMDRWGEPSDPVKLPDGSEYIVTVMLDENAGLEEYGDWYGRLKWGDYHHRQRPDGFDGAAEKISMRDGFLWWQPPEDVKSAPERREWIRERVQGYYLDHWIYVGLVVTLYSAPCPKCGERAEHQASLWGIESDADHSYIREVVSELLSEAQHEN